MLTARADDVFFDLILMRHVKPYDRSHGERLTWHDLAAYGAANNTASQRFVGAEGLVVRKGIVRIDARGGNGARVNAEAPKWEETYFMK